MHLPTLLRGPVRAAAVLGAAGAVTATVLVAGPGSLSGATPQATDVSFVGYSGGTFVRAANNTVTSALTAASELNTVYNPIATSNDAAGLSAANLISGGAVTTSVRTETLTDGYRVVSTSRTAGISALGGVITASAIETTSTATITSTGATADTSTNLVGLKIAGKAIPVNVPRNFTIRIPGIATVALNYAQAGGQGRAASTLGIGAYVSLLSPRGGNGIGAELAISPTYAALAPVKVPDSGHYLGGRAYGSSVKVDVGSLVNVHSDQTAPIGLGALGTDSVTKETSIAALSLGAAARIGAVRSTAVGTNTTTRYTARTTNTVGGVNLLGGAITATALGTTAQVTGIPKLGAPAVTGSATVADLKIGSVRVPLNAAPNTTIALGSLAKVVVNQQVRTGSSITVRALVVTLSTAAYGLPAGAEIVVSSASASAS